MVKCYSHGSMDQPPPGYLPCMQYPLVITQWESQLSEKLSQSHSVWVTVILIYLITASECSNSDVGDSDRVLCSVPHFTVSHSCYLYWASLIVGA